MPPAGERITVAELGRRLDDFKRDVKEDIGHLAEQVSRLSFVDRETLDTKLLLEQAHRAELERRIAHLESRDERRDADAAANRRLAITGLVFPIIVLVLGTLILASIGFR